MAEPVRAVYQAEYSRNLLFKSGARMEALFDRILDRTVPAGHPGDPHHLRAQDPAAPDGLRERIIDDYTARPVSRDAAP